MFLFGLTAGWLGWAAPGLVGAEQTVATAVSARVGNGYKRERQADGSFKPEYFALSNGGRVAGTTTDATIDRVTYPEVADIAIRLLAGQNYRYAENKEQASLLLVLYWGATIGFNRENYDDRLRSASESLSAMNSGGTGRNWASLAPPVGSEEAAAASSGAAAFEGEMFRMLTENKARQDLNLPNARLLGFLDEINESDGIQRYAGAGARFDDLVADIEESRYYIIISAYDFQELVKHDRKKLLWTTRVSVRTPGNRFDDSMAAMLKGASKYFGQNSGKLIRGVESKGTVQFGDVEFLGEAKRSNESKPETGK
jgi:hypothetical protein